MCGDGRDDDDPEGIPSQDCKTYCGYDCTEEIQRGMGVGLGGRGNGSDSALDYKTVHVEFVGKNCEVCCREVNKRTVYRRREDRGIHQVPQVVKPRAQTHTG